MGGTHSRQLEPHPRRWAWCPEKHPRYPLRQPCLAAEGPGWRRCFAKIHSLSVECGCWFSHLDFAGIPPITSTHHHHYRRHLHTCVKKTCPFAKAITTSEQMATSPHLHLSLLLSVPCRDGASSGPGVLGAGPKDPPPSCHWPGLALSRGHRPSCVFTQGLGRRGRARRNVAPARTPSLISPLLGSSGEGRTPSPPHQPPPWEKAKAEQDVRSLLPQTAFLTLLPFCPALLFSSRPSSLSVGGSILSGCPHFFLSSFC